MSTEKKIFQLCLKNFEGPLDVLLRMVEKKKMLVNDVSLASITDEYLQFVSNLKEKEAFSDLIYFLTIATILTLIKSKSLLPHIDLTPEEETDIEVLKKRAEFLNFFQKIALKLKSSFHSYPQFYYAKTKEKNISFQPHKQINKENMKKVCLDLFERNKKQINKEKKGSVEKQIPIERLIYSLESHIDRFHSLNFQDFAEKSSMRYNQEKGKKIHYIVSFLALLEVIKKLNLKVSQKKHFSSIIIQLS